MQHAIRRTSREPKTQRLFSGLNNSIDLDFVKNEKTICVVTARELILINKMLNIVSCVWVDVFRFTLFAASVYLLFLSSQQIGIKLCDHSRQLPLDLLYLPDGFHFSTFMSRPKYNIRKNRKRYRAIFFLCIPVRCLYIGFGFPTHIHKTSKNIPNTFLYILYTYQIFSIYTLYILLTDYTQDCV